MNSLGPDAAPVYSQVSQAPNVVVAAEPGSRPTSSVLTSVSWTPSERSSASMLEALVWKPPHMRRLFTMRANADPSDPSDAPRVTVVPVFGMLSTAPR